MRACHPWPWYESADPPKPLICGHLDYLRDGTPLIHRRSVYGLDTGCCHGGYLTGLLLPEFRIIQVRARTDHWEAVKAAYIPRLTEKGLPRRDSAESIWQRLRQVPAERLTWRQSAEALALAEGEEPPDEALRDAIDRLTRCAREAEAAISGFTSSVMDECRRLTMDIEGNGLAITSPDFARAFSQQVRDHPWRHFLQLARRGRLDHSAIRDSCKGPGEFLDAMVHPAREDND
jgi:serine/threonine protein phosphatase 1